MPVASCWQVVGLAPVGASGLAVVTGVGRLTLIVSPRDGGARGGDFAISQYEGGVIGIIGTRAEVIV
jgi:hypothetical protein